MPLFQNRGMRGQPTRPYRDFLVNANSDCFLELTFVDRFGAANTPTSVTYQIDNLTDNLNIVPATALTPPIAPANTLELDITAATNQMSYSWRGSQLNQVLVTAVLSDGSQAAQVFVYELCSTPVAS